MLFGSGLVFSLIAIAAVFAPNAVASRYGLTIAGVDAMNEFRAIFTGFWLGLGALMISAARHTEIPILGDLCAWMLCLQAAGRLLSVAIDGTPSPQFLGALVLEALSGVAILALGRRREARELAGHR